MFFFSLQQSYLAGTLCTATCEQCMQQKQIVKLWFASQTRKPRLELLHSSCLQTNISECRTSSALILRICKKSFNRQQDLQCVPCWHCQCFTAPAFSLRQPAALHKTQPKPLFTVRNHSELYMWFLVRPSGELSIVCKSSNQHAQNLFNFTASRVALISSCHLGCLPFKSNG